MLLAHLIVLRQVDRLHRPYVSALLTVFRRPKANYSGEVAGFFEGLWVSLPGNFARIFRGSDKLLVASRFIDKLDTRKVASFIEEDAIEGGIFERKVSMFLVVLALF